MKRPNRCRYLALSTLLLLAACGGSDPPAQAPSSAPETTPTEPASQTPAAPVVAVVASVETAEAALRAQRLFAPAGDNAFELFVLALEAKPDLTKAQDALTDLFPYGVLHVEQRTAARDAEEARRVLDLLARAQPEAPALERLERELERLERRLATEREAVPPARPVAPTQPAEPAVPAPPPVVSAPEPVAPEPAEPAPAPVVTPPPAAPVVVAPPPPVETAQPAQPRTPRMIRQPQLRYPEQAARQGINGSVTLDFQIDADGGVSDVRVVSSVPRNIFDREAIQAMRRTRFEPPSEPMRVRRTIDFNLER
ncbi:energy transducer TonB [Aquimonas sp.]|jgi:protein TonB|uniref:energy transducer TonB n=1 Tax=Aquimonas sp. TaxID=1872588 RepID=UPI0037C12DFE